MVSSLQCGGVKILSARAPCSVGGCLQTQDWWKGGLLGACGGFWVFLWRHRPWLEAGQEEMTTGGETEAQPHNLSFGRQSGQTKLGHRFERSSEEAAPALWMAVEASSWPAGCMGPDTCVLPKSPWFCVQFPIA